MTSNEAVPRATCWRSSARCATRCGPTDNDCDLSGAPDECDPDGGGEMDACQPFPDCNGSGIPDRCELVGDDCDGDPVPDERQPDCDLGGHPDACEGEPDSRANGVLDSGDAGLADCNQDSVPGDCEDDGDTNDTPDSCECAAPGEDCLPGSNSLGNLARIEALGLPSLAVNQLILRVSRMPANKPGLFFHGANAANQPLGCGKLCVAAPITRMGPPAVSSSGGELERQLDLGRDGL